MDKKEALGQIIIATHDVWDLEAFGREVRRRKVLERLYRKLHRYRNAEGVDFALNPTEIMSFVYSRAADGYPWWEP